jgi:hypothetical protein
MSLRDTATDHGSQIPPVDMYKIALDEYRFEVKLNADRTIQFLTLSIAVLSAGVGLLRFGNPGASTAIFVGFIFLCGMAIALLGAKAVLRGHEYYRRTVLQKTVIENSLGLHIPPKNYPRTTLAIATTRGQGEVHQMLSDPERWLSKGSLHWGTITSFVVAVLFLIAAAHLTGIAILVYQIAR